MNYVENAIGAGISGTLCYMFRDKAWVAPATAVSGLALHALGKKSEGNHTHDVSLGLFPVGLGFSVYNIGKAVYHSKHTPGLTTLTNIGLNLLPLIIRAVQLHSSNGDDSDEPEVNEL